LASIDTTKVSSIVGWTVLVVLLDLLLVFYVMSHGFESMANQLVIGGFSLQLEWLPLLGVLIVSLAVWSDAFTRIFPRWLGPEADPMARLRFVRMFMVSLTAFVCVLYIPYLLGSNWFFLHLSHLSKVIRPLSGFGNWLENLEMPVLTLDPVWQYSITQLLACLALVFFVWALARPAKRVRKVR